MVRIVAGSAVAEPDVQEAVGTEGESGGIVESAGLRGMTLRPVLDPGGAPVPWFQVAKV